MHKVDYCDEFSNISELLNKLDYPFSQSKNFHSILMFHMLHIPVLLYVCSKEGLTVGLFICSFGIFVYILRAHFYASKEIFSYQIPYKIFMESRWKNYVDYVEFCEPFSSIVLFKKFSWFLISLKIFFLLLSPTLRARIC